MLNSISYIRPVKADCDCVYRCLYYRILEHITLDIKSLKQFYCSYILTSKSPLLMTSFDTLIKIRGLIDSKQIGEDVINAYIFTLCNNSIEFDSSFIRVIRKAIYNLLNDEKRNASIIESIRDTDLTQLSKQILDAGGEGKDTMIKIASVAFATKIILFTLSENEISQKCTFESQSTSELMTIRVLHFKNNYYIVYNDKEVKYSPCKIITDKLLANVLC
jgi:hypothetical protein